MVALIIGREVAVTVLRGLAYTKGITIPASPLGKIKMASQVTAILLLILAAAPSVAGASGARGIVGGDDGGGRFGL